MDEARSEQNLFGALLAQRGADPCRFLGCTTGCAREYTYPSAESMRCSEVKNRT